MPLDHNKTESLANVIAIAVIKSGVIRMQIKHTDNYCNIGIVPISDIIKHTTGFNLAEALLFMQNLSICLGNHAEKKVYGKDKKWLLITAEANAFITKCLINNSSELSSKKYTCIDHKKSTLLFHHLEDDLSMLNVNDKDAYKCSIRKIYSQWRYKRNPSHLLSRYYIIFNNLETENAKQVNDMLRNAVKLSFTEIAGILVGIFTNEGLDMTRLPNKSDKGMVLNNYMTEEKVLLFLDQYCTDVDTFRKICCNLSDVPYLEKYLYNPLWRHPIIKINSGSDKKEKYLIPSIPDLIYACTEGVYYVLMDYYRDGKANPLSTKFGYLFEDYVEYLLKLASIEDYKRETPSETSNSNMPDFLLKHNDIPINIECKKRKLSIECKACVGNKFEDYMAEIAESIYAQGQVHFVV